MSCPRAQIDLVACEGATFEKNFVWKTGDPATEVDLTGYSGLCHIRDRITDDEPAFVLEADTGVVIKDQVSDTGGYKLFISDEDMQEACPRHKQRSMVYDLQLTDSAGKVRLHQYGQFTIYPAVTRPWQT